MKFKDLSENFPNEWIWIFENITGNDISYYKFPVMKYLNEGYLM